MDQFFYVLEGSIPPVALYSFAEMSLGQSQLVFYVLAQRRIVAGFAGGIKEWRSCRQML